MLTWINKTKARFFPAESGPFVALDLDSRKLKVVFAEPRSGLPRFKKLAVIDVPEGTDMADPKAVGEFIGKSLRDLGLGGMRVAMDVPRNKAVLKTITLPAIDDERELPGMVRYQVEKELPFGLDEAVIDFTVESHLGATATPPAVPVETLEGEEAAPGPTQTILVAAVRRSIVDHYRAIAQAADVELQQLGLRPYADVHCLKACLGGRGESELANAMLIHLSSDEAEINVLIDGALAFSRSASMQTPHNEAGEPMAASPVESLVVEVVRTLGSIRAFQRDAKIGHIWVAGDTSHEEPLVAALTTRLKTVCEKLSPVKSLAIRNAPAGSNGYITALGLAIGHTGSGMPLDFLHPKEPLPPRDIKKERIRAIAIGVGAVFGLVVGLGLVNLSVKNSRLTALKAVYNELDKEKGLIDKLSGNYKAVDKWVAEDQRWLDHWANLSALFPPAQEAYVSALHTNQGAAISVTVKAKSSQTITDLTKKLREAGYDVKLGAETTENDDLGYNYTNPLTLTVNKTKAIDVAKLQAPPRPADDGSADPNLRGGSRSGGFGPPSGSPSPGFGQPPSGPTSPSTPNSGRPSFGGSSREGSRFGGRESRESDRESRDRSRGNSPQTPPGGEQPGSTPAPSAPTPAPEPSEQPEPRRIEIRIGGQPNAGGDR